MSRPQIEDSFLDVGWIVNEHLDPAWCVGGKERIPEYKDMLRIPTKKMDKHTVIIAQSGSGKSFFLGRIIEELMIKSKARCLILDPNGDFRKISKIDEELWCSYQHSSQRYSVATGQGKLTLETKDEFAKKWYQVIQNFVIRTNRIPKEPGDMELKIWWPSVSLEFLTQETDFRTRTEMFHCHNWAKELFNQFAQLPEDTNEQDIVGIVKNIFKTLQTMPTEERDKLVEKWKTEEGNVVETLKKPKVSGRSELMAMFKRTVKSSSLFDSVISLGVGTAGSHSLEKAKYVFESYSWDTVNSYFGILEEYQSMGILANRPAISELQRRLTVIDLPSLVNSDLRTLVLNSILTEEWENAKKNWETAMNNPSDEDKRVPTFIILDEAHNFIPSMPRSRHESLVREQFRTIAAEGRKFGLFLILVSQRADKLDDLVLSECGNKAILRLDSRSMADRVIETLGLTYDVDSDTSEKISNFKPGRVMIAGNWAAHDPSFFYCAARRTIEGGRNLKDKYWATPF